MAIFLGKTGLRTDITYPTCCSTHEEGRRLIESETWSQDFEKEADATLANSHAIIGSLLNNIGEPAKALESYGRAFDPGAAGGGQPLDRGVSSWFEDQLDCFRSHSRPAGASGASYRSSPSRDIS